MSRRNSLWWARTFQHWRFQITLRHTTLGRTPPDEGSARCRDVYRQQSIVTRDRHRWPQWDLNTMQRPLLTKVNSHKRQTSMTPVRFEHDTETSTDNSQQSQETDIDDPSGIRTRNPSKLSGCRSKTQTARPLESALVLILEPNTFTKKTGIMRWVGNEAHYSFSSSFPSSFVVVVVVVVVAQDILRCNNDAL